MVIFLTADASPLIFLRNTIWGRTVQLSVLKLPVPFLSPHYEVRHPKANCPTVLSSPSFAIMNTMMTGHLLHGFHNFLTFEDMKSSHQKGISRSTFSKTKVHCQHISKRQIPSIKTDATSDPHLLFLLQKHHPICTRGPDYNSSRQMSCLLHCPFILTQMFSTMLTICFEDSHKDMYLTHVQH